ncbi:MAG TPA: hypothetical protein VNB94_12330 [Mycobacteriales bacterium]|nr:hypothetical protein [Mycobacteriales bacterium]
MTDPAHPDSETLAAYADGDLEHAGAVTVAAHLPGCADCSADVAAIERVRGALGALPSLRMPDEVVTSLERALDAQRSAGPASTPESVPAGPAVPTSLADARRRRRPSLVPFAAAAAVIGLAAAVGVGALRSSNDSSDNSSVAADAGSDSAGKAAPPLQLQTGTDYTAATLADQVRSVISGPQAFALEAAPPQGDAQDSGSGAAGSALTQDSRARGAAAPLPLAPADLDSCLQELSGGPGAVPVVVDSATYAGQPAVVIVLPFRTDKLDVFVVRPDCRVGNDALILFQRIDA